MSAKELTEDVLRNLRKISRAIDLHSKKLVQNHGLTGPQAVILREIRKHEQISPSALATKVSLSHATVTDILNRLSQKGLVTRRKSETDRRRILASLTEQGTAMIDDFPSLLQDRFIRNFEQLQDWEQTLILSTLQRIAGLMNVENMDVAPLLDSGSLTEPYLGE